MAYTLMTALQALLRKGYNVVSIGDKEYLIKDYISLHGEQQLTKRVDYMEFRLWAEIYDGDDTDIPIAVVKL